MLKTTKRRTLRSQVALFNALLALFLLLTIGLFNDYQTRITLKQRLFRYLNDAAARLVVELDERVLVRKVVLLQAASAVVPDQALWAREAGRLLIHTPLLSSLFDNVLLYDQYGNNVSGYSKHQHSPPINIVNREYFQLTKSQKQPQISISSPLNGYFSRHTIIFTVPLVNTRGQFVGMLEGDLELFSPGFLRGLEGGVAEEGGYVSLHATRAKLNILHPDPSKIMQLIPSEADCPVLYRAMRGLPAVDELIMGGNEAVLAVYHPMKQVDWVVGRTLPVTEAYSLIERLTKRFLLFGIGGILLLLPLSIWWTKRVLRPLDVLKAQMELLKVSSPQLELLPISECEELQSVADVINRVLAERSTFESRLMQREAFFRALNDASPLGVFVVNERGIIDYVNDACRRLGGSVSEEERVGQHWLAAVHSEDHERLLQLGREVQKGLRDRFLTRCRLYHTQQPYVRVEVRLVRLQHEIPERFLGIVMDVTEQEATRAALLAERERALAILGSIGDAVVLANHLDEIEFLNPPAELLLGKRAADTLGRPLYTFVSFSLPENGLPMSLSRLEALAGQPHRELDMMAGDARIQPVVLTLSTIAAQGNMHGYRVYVLHDDSARRERERTHRWEANHDPLTGLLNRRGYLAALSSLLSSPSRGKASHAVVLMDLDHFKVVNDVAGHLAGDRLLQEVAGVIQTRLRSTDVAARLGGDEFAMLLYNCSAEDAIVFLEAIRHQVENYQLYHEGQTLQVTASIGLTLVQASDSVPSDLLQRADNCCYRAKDKGRNRLVAC